MKTSKRMTRALMVVLAAVVLLVTKKRMNSAK